jgi:hypothetical protein
MNTFRSMALTLVAGAAALSVTACTAGITTASSPPTTPAASAHPATFSASNTSPANPAVPASTVAISGALGSFPVPAGAKIAENVSTSQEIIIFYSGISPAKVSAFYVAALPRDGYKITSNAVIIVSGVNETAIQFSGHGYKGMIAALANFPRGSATIPGLGDKNVTDVTLTPQ